MYYVHTYLFYRLQSLLFMQPNGVIWHNSILSIYILMIILYYQYLIIYILLTAGVGKDVCNIFRAVYHFSGPFRLKINEALSQK